MMSFDEFSSLRIIDANLNRAREALRVMEEYARLVLNDAGLSGAIKNARHDLTRAVPASIAADLPGHRDIEGDVGRATETPEEYHRSGVLDVARAAAKRLSEALRAIEEYAKTIDEGFARAVEGLRYRGYELERRLLLGAQAKERFGHVRLYIIITEALCRLDWFETAEAALNGGADCLQLREKNLSDRVLLARAKRLAALCREHEALFIVNDRVDIAAAGGAHGVHLGQDDLSVQEARRLLPSQCIVGLSTHTIAEVESAMKEGPDYIAVGPMFDTATKPQDRIAGPESVKAARSHTSLPLVAVGGIDESNVDRVVVAPPSAVCVCRAVIADPAPGQIVSRLRAAIEASMSSVTSQERV